MMGATTKLTGILVTGLATVVMTAQVPNPVQKTYQTNSNANEVVRMDENPLYRVTVVEQSTVAVNYTNRDASTRINFRGTVLLPDVEGKAEVRNRRGSTEIDAEIKGLQDPSRFGRQYLTYVLWAITPEGRATNLGQLVADHNNKAEIRATTEMQTFALLVTAEPYYAVSQPSDVVVAENVLHPLTVGRVQTVRAKAELLKRGAYLYDAEIGRDRANESRRMVGKKEYEALLELYQAQHAINLARSQGAAEFAAPTLDKAQSLIDTAQRYLDNKSFEQVIPVAREATQFAEDARIMAIRRQEDRSAPRLSTSVQ